jgi:hypothetical protein
MGSTRKGHSAQGKMSVRWDRELEELGKRRSERRIIKG